MSDPDFAWIEPALRARGIYPEQAVRVRITRFVDLLEHWNRRINLTGHRRRRDIFLRHVLDCLMLETLAWPEGTANVLDIGSGAGLPGMLLAILHPDWRVTSIDRAGKKIAFQRVAARELGLTNFSPAQADVRQWAGDPATRGGFDLAVARAFGPLKDLLVLAAALLRPGGVLWAMKGQKLAQEQAQVPPALLNQFEAPVHPVAYDCGALDVGGVVAVYRKR